MRHMNQHSWAWLVAAAMTVFSVGAERAEAGSYRSIDGSGNNIANPDWGQAHVQLLRLTTPAYEDGLSEPRGGFASTLPSARAISNAVAAQSGSTPNAVGASDWLWQWGQFLDHDLDLSDPASPAEPFNVPVPQGDPFFDPFNTGTQEIGLSRTLYDTSTGIINPRQQENEITAYIDASNLYGSDSVRAAFLRENAGGRLLMPGGLLQFNTAGLPNAGGTGSDLYISGDPRANEQIGLLATHTLFSREHNRLAASVEQRLQANDAALVAKRDAAISEPGNGVDTEDDFIYESVRKVVGAQMQKITYNEFLPVLLGPSAIGAYQGYDDTVNAGVTNEFSTAAYRVGHTMLSPTLLRLNNDGTEAAEGNIALQDAFFTPDEITDHGIDSILKGLASQEAQEVDTQIIDDVRNFLFGPPGAGGFDLASLNIQRGRDHGLPAYNDVRSQLGLAPATDFLDLTDGDATLAAAFASVYSSVNDVDLWIGGLAEQHVGGGVVGETFGFILADQFQRLMDGDRFFYLGDLEHIRVIDPDFDATTLSEIIMRNTDLTGLQANVFFVVPEPGVLALAAVAGALGLAGRRRG